MLQKIIYFIFLLFANNALANCDIGSQFNINIQVLPIKYDYTKTSYEIQNIPNVKRFDDTKYILGAYLSTLRLSSNYEMIYENNLLNSNYCSKIKTMNVTLELESSIYIAKEIIPYGCTLNRTIHHELMHYNFEKDSLNQGINYLKTSLEPVFSKKFNGTQAEFVQLTKNQLNTLQKNTFFLIDDFATKQHNTIDTPENYKKESQLCSDIEHNTVSKIILKI